MKLCSRAMRSPQAPANARVQLWGKIHAPIGRWSMQAFRLSWVACLIAMGTFSASAYAGAGLSGFGVTPSPPPTATKGPLPMTKAPTPPAGSEFCGIVGSTDYLFADGFEGTTPQINYLYSTRSVTGSSPTVSITYPSGGSTVPSTTTVVFGTYTGPADTGIIVNGVKAYTSGGMFFAPVIGLSTGSNTLQATATTLTGTAANSGITVTQGGAPYPIQLSSVLATNFAPASITFTAHANSGITISQLKMDYDGNGVDDLVTTNPATALTHVYNTPGEYTARLTIVDNTTTPSPTTYVTYLPVFVQDMVETRETLCSVFGYLRTSLTAANVSQAVQVFALEQQPYYQSFYNSITSANLPVAASRMGAIANGVINSDFAQLKVVKPFNGVMASFSVDFSRDENGIWRIDAL